MNQPPKGNENEYKEKFLNEQKKYFTDYLDFEKWENRNNSYEFLMKELLKLEANCPEATYKHVMAKKQLLKSKNAKKLCRDGIPLKYLKPVLLKMFHVSSSPKDYKNQINLVLKTQSINNFNDYIPYFTNWSLEESWPVHYWNGDGIEAWKEVLWLLSSVNPSIEYSPIWIKLTSIILWFFTKDETYELMRNIIELNMNAENLENWNWHFRFTYLENLKINGSNLDAIIEYGDKGTNEKLKMITDLGSSKLRLVSDMTQSLFLSYLDFLSIIHILPYFLNEGVKAIYRLSYAIITSTDYAIKARLSEHEAMVFYREAVRTKVKNISVLKEISYKYNLRHNTFLQQKIQNVDSLLSRRRIYHIPSLKINSKIINLHRIISKQDRVRLWSWLPHEYKVNDLILIYDQVSSPEADLTSLFDICSKLEKNEVFLFLVQTDSDEVFGGIMNQSFALCPDGHYLEPELINWITIKPETNVYYPHKKATEKVLFEPGALRFGNGPDGPAISIDQDLRTGWTEKETIFGNVNLLKDSNSEGGFKIKNMELYLLL